MVLVVAENDDADWNQDCIFSDVVEDVDLFSCLHKRKGRLIS